MSWKLDGFKSSLLQPKLCLNYHGDKAAIFLWAVLKLIEWLMAVLGPFQYPTGMPPSKPKQHQKVFFVTCFGSVTVCSFCDHFVLPDCVALGMMGRKIHLSVNTPQATCCHSRLLHVSVPREQNHCKSEISGRVPCLLLSDPPHSAKFSACFGCNPKHYAISMKHL